MQRIFLFLLVGAFLASCSTSNDVVSKGPFSKRKYRPGFHHDFALKKAFKRSTEEPDTGLAQNGTGEKRPSSLLADVERTPSEDLNIETPLERAKRKELEQADMSQIDRVQPWSARKPFKFNKKRSRAPEKESWRNPGKMRYGMGVWALVFAILVNAIYIFNSVALYLGITIPLFALLLLGLTLLVSLILALIFGFKTRKFSNAGRWALWLILIYVGLIIINTAIGLVIGIALIGV